MITSIMNNQIKYDILNNTNKLLNAIATSITRWKVTEAYKFVVLTNMVSDTKASLNALRPRQNCHHFADDIFKCVFSWMKMYEFRLGFNWRLFLNFLTNWQFSSIGSDNGLVPTGRQAIIWTNVGLFTDAYVRRSASMN